MLVLQCHNLDSRMSREDPKSGEMQQKRTLVCSPVQEFVSLIISSATNTPLGYGLDDRGSGVRFPAEAGNFSPHHRVQNCSGAHPASYPMRTRGSFPGGKAAGA
jgi:hypothetical protein